MNHSHAIWAFLTAFWLVVPASAADLRFHESQSQMGSRFEVVLYAASEVEAHAALAAAFDRVRELNESMSDYDSRSELSQLSKSAPTAHPIQLSPDLCAVLELALRVSRASGGAFDVTVGPLTRQWRRARRRHQLPDAQRLAESLQSVGYQHLTLDTGLKTASLARPQMRLDLGGIAKGYAAQQMLSVLQAAGIERALVNAGGDIAASKSPPDATGWKVGVMPMGTRKQPLEFVEIAELAVATSGDAWQFVEIDGVRYSHIVDPRTGLGTTRRGGVTVVSKDGALSDALASALAVLDVDEGMELIAQYAGASARIVWLEGEQYRVRSSAGFPALSTP